MAKVPFPQSEAELSKPVNQWLEAQGYQINHEVRNCDITAVKGEELLILELKLRFNLTLVYQALERKRMTPSVYVVIPLKGSRSAPPQYKRMRLLLQNLQIGLLVVRYLRGGPRVEMLLHPREYRQQNRVKAKAAILREIQNRYGEFNRGGQASTVQQVTAYRQEALRIAWLLERQGESSPASLRKLGCGSKTQSILSMNHYGWFNRTGRGRYALDAAGMEALKQNRTILNELIPLWEKDQPCGEALSPA